MSTIVPIAGSPYGDVANCETKESSKENITATSAQRQRRKCGERRLV